MFYYKSKTCSCYWILYHDINLLKLYNQKKLNLDDFLKSIDDVNYYDAQFLLNKFNTDIFNFTSRENKDNIGYYIPVAEVIANNYQKKLQKGDGKALDFSSGMKAPLPASYNDTYLNKYLLLYYL